MLCYARMDSSYIFGYNLVIDIINIVDVAKKQMNVAESKLHSTHLASLLEDLPNIFTAKSFDILSMHFIQNFVRISNPVGFRCHVVDWYIDTCTTHYMYITIHVHHITCILQYMYTTVHAHHGTCTCITVHVHYSTSTSQ